MYDSKSDFTSKKNIAVSLRVLQKRQGISLDVALEFFYHSEVYQLIRDGVSDMHCMSDVYLAEELEQEYAGKMPDAKGGKNDLPLPFSCAFSCKCLA